MVLKGYSPGEERRQGSSNVVRSSDTTLAMLEQTGPMRPGMHSILLLLSLFTLVSPSEEPFTGILGPVLSKGNHGIQEWLLQGH